MTREQLEPVIRAAAAITKELSFVVIGSQAVLLPYPDAHPDLLVSRELYLYPAMAIPALPGRRYCGLPRYA